MPSRSEVLPSSARDAHGEANWAAVIGLALCSFVVNASEFIPVGLISPIADTLNLSEGETGQANAVSGIFSVTTSLFLGRLVGGADRRRVLLGLIALLLVANVVVSLANSHQTLMAGRALLGVVVGGFWSMSAAVAMRLVPGSDVPKALAIVNGGSALAFAMIGPLGSYMGDLIGWRGTFLGMVPLVALAGLWQFLALKPLRVDERLGKGAILSLLRDPLLVSGMVAVGLFYAGQFSLFTYLRPFLEQVSGITGWLLSVMLLVVGVSGLAGAAVVGRLLDDRRLYLIMGGLASLMAVTAVALALFGTNVWVVAVLLAVWGFTGTAAPAAWWTWLARSAPDDAEAGGGLLVAVMQAAIALGAAGGGIVFDRYGAATQFLCSAGLLALTAVAVAGLVHLRRRSRRREVIPSIQHQLGV